MKTEPLIRTKLMDRRHFLGAAAVGAAGLGLAACSSDDEAPAQETAVPTVAAPKISGSIAEARDAVLPAFPESRTTDLVIEAIDVTYEVAAGVPFKSWTLGGTVPSPVLHFRQGDTVNFQLVNNGSAPHSIDFHAAQIDWEVNYRSIPVGESLEFQWTADVPGAFMSHCGTPPVAAPHCQRHVRRSDRGAGERLPAGRGQRVLARPERILSAAHQRRHVDGQYGQNEGRDAGLPGMERHGLPVSRAPASSQGWGAYSVPRRQLRPNALVSVPHHRCVDGRRLCGRSPGEPAA